MLRLAPIILRNILRNRRRSILTLGSTAISLMLLTLMIAIYLGFFHAEDASPSEALRIVTRHKVSLTQPLPASYQAQIRQVPGVKYVSAYSWFQGKYIDERHFFARFAVDADEIFNIHPDWIISPDQLAAFKKERTACALGENIAKQFNIKLGDTLHIEGDIYPVNLELKCVAIFAHPPNTEALVFHREYLRELLPATSPTRDTVGTYLLLADSVDAVPRISRAIDTLYENSPYPTRTESEKEFGRSFLAFLGNIRLFLAAICAAVTFTILLVSANTISMAVRERTRETAILRTLGYTPGEILQLIIGEAIVISLLGGIVGIGLGALLAKASSGGGGGFGLPPVRWEGALAVLAIAAVVGLLAAIVPAVAASRKNIVESLRFTG